MKPILMNDILLLCGYRRTGKDTFFTQLNQTSSLPFNYRVYIRPQQDALPIFIRPHYVQGALADMLRKEVFEYNHLPPNFPYEENKDKSLTGEGPTLRDILIAWGAARRAENIDYWAEKLFEQFSLDKNGATLVVTDFRFLNEYIYSNKAYPGKVTTIRLFRSCVPIPDPNIESEHQLDNFTTDFLLVPEENHRKEFATALELFPQYHDYVPINERSHYLLTCLLSPKLRRFNPATRKLQVFSDYLPILSHSQVWVSPEKS